MSVNITIEVATQTLTVLKGGERLQQYPVSTAILGTGSERNSFKTPLGAHIIRAKIGQDAPYNSIFVARRRTGEIYSPEFAKHYPDRDWILTRILWLSGLEKGKNRLGDCDTMRRYIYMHGCPDEASMGVVGSHGCIRIRNSDIIELFDQVEAGTIVQINP